MRTLTLALSSIAMLGCHGSSNNKPSDHVEHATPTPTKSAEVPGDKDGNGAVAPSQPPGPPATAATTPQVTSFDGGKPDAAPSGFTFGRTGSGAQGTWVIKAEAGAPSGGNVLAQTDADATDYRFPIALLDTPSIADVRVSVRCKAVSGKVDQACGLVFRAADADNYYVTRANALENNVRLYHVVKGKRTQFGSWNGKVKTAAWHELRVDAKGDRLEVYFDGARVIEATDATFEQAGKVGLWTKADSVTYFDDLTVTAL
jgi:hypothetical protein